MLTYDLDRRGTIPRYDYLCRCIRDDILCGRLTAGSRLPSRRSLAEHLKVSAVTVESAYAQLAAEGYIVSREKSGYFVSQLEPALRPPVPRPPSGPMLRPRGSPWMMDLRGGGGSTELFPFSVWAKLMRQVLSQRGPDLLRPVPHSGVPELREAIAGTLYRLRGLSVSPEQIVVGSGSEYLYNLIVQLLGRELVYGVEDPGYPKPARIYALNGARCISLPVDGQGISPQTLAASPAQVVHLSPSHQFPTGAVTPAGRRQALLRWAAQGGDRYLIEDDYDSEFRFTGLPIPALQSIDQADRVIYLNTFSRLWPPPCASVIWCCLPPCWTAITSAWGSTPPPSPPWSSTPWPPSSQRGASSSTSAGPGTATGPSVTRCWRPWRPAAWPAGPRSPVRTRGSTSWSGWRRSAATRS